MESISDLPRLRCTGLRALRVKTAAIATDDFYLWILPEPFGCPGGRPVLQQIDNLAPLQIDDDGPVGVTLSPTPVVDEKKKGGGGGPSHDQKDEETQLFDRFGGREDQQYPAIDLQMSVGGISRSDIASDSPYPQRHRGTLRRKVLKMPHILAVPPCRLLATSRTDARSRSYRRDYPEVAVPF